MPDATFTWYPDAGSSHECKPRVSVTKFGDGYEQRTPEGINTLPMQWSLTFSREKTEALEILAFLRERGGSKSFNWTNPLEEAGIYVCREWNPTQLRGGAIQIVCSFEQVFEY